MAGAQQAAAAKRKAYMVLAGTGEASAVQQC
jgi:hypothetical protein